MAVQRMHAPNGHRGDGDPDASPPRADLSLPINLARFHEVIAEVDGYLHSEGWTDVRYAYHTRSARAVIVLVMARQSERLEPYVLKIFTREIDFGVCQYVSLGLFSKHLHELNASVHCPTPVLGRHNWYLMNYINAPNLEQWLAYGPRARWERMAALIVLGLQAYHDAVSEIYGEFHSRHIFVQEDDSLCFFDCSIPRHDFPTADMRAYSLLAHDIGYWLHATIGRSLRRIFDPDTPSLTLLRFTKLLVDQAASRSPGTRREFVGEVLAVLAELRQSEVHGRRLRAWPVMLLSRLILADPRRRACS